MLDNTRHGTTSGFCRRESRNLTMERREYSVCVREAVIHVGNRRIMRCIRVWIGNERATRWAMRQHMYDGKSGENGWPVSWIARNILFFFRYWYWGILYVYGLYGYLVEMMVVCWFIEYFFDYWWSIGRILDEH